MNKQYNWKLLCQLKPDNPILSIIWLLWITTCSYVSTNGVIFTDSAPLLQLSHRVAMSVCLSVCGIIWSFHQIGPLGGFGLVVAMSMVGWIYIYVPSSDFSQTWAKPGAALQTHPSLINSLIQSVRLFLPHFYGAATPKRLKIALKVIK